MLLPEESDKARARLGSQWGSVCVGIGKGGGELMSDLRACVQVAWGLLTTAVWAERSDVLGCLGTS